MGKKPDIIETEIFSQLIGNRVLKIEQEDPGPINLEKFTEKKPTEATKEVKYDFKQGDLVVPNTGIENAFFFQRNMKLNPKYLYHKANSAEETYFYKKVQDYKRSVNTYSEIQTIAHEEYDYDKDKEKNPGTRLI